MSPQSLNYPFANGILSNFFNWSVAGTMNAQEKWKSRIGFPLIPKEKKQSAKNDQGTI